MENIQYMLTGFAMRCVGEPISFSCDLLGNRDGIQFRVRTYLGDGAYREANRLIHGDLHAYFSLDYGIAIADALLSDLQRG